MTRKKAESPPEVEMPDAEEIPEGWYQTPLSNILDSLESGSRPKGGVRGIESGIPSIGGEHLNENGGFRFENIKFIPQDFFEKMRRGRIQKGDVLIVKDGATTGKVSLVRSDFPYNPAMVNEHVFICRVKPDIFPPFAFWFLFSEVGQKRILENFQGSAQGGINQTFADYTILPIAPTFKEQEIAVARIETLLAHVNAARERLDRVPLVMKRFRQGVLAAACSGRLTESWREAQKELESSSDLYNRIQSSRMQKYEQAVVEAKKPKKKLPLKPSFFENREPDSCNTAEIPNEWIWKKVVNLGPFGEDTVKTGPFGAILKSKEFVSSGVPIIAIGNVQWGKFDLNGARVDHVTEEKASELENYRVRTGDVLFTRSGTIGRSLVVPDFADHWLMSYHLLRVRADPNLIIPQYLYFVFAGCESSKEYTSDATIGSTRPGINTTILENLPVPLPPLAEQHEIVRRVNALFARADIVEREVAVATKRAEALTHAVLARAFAGKL